MTISYPLALPTVTTAKAITIRARSTVAMSASPFTGEQQVYVHQGEWWEADVQLPPMVRADAEIWVAWLVALNGREGTFTMGDPVGATALGSASGTVTVNGGSQTGKVLAVSGLTGTIKAGSWIQLGSGSGTHLHKVVADGTTSLDIWPRLRSSPGNGDSVVIASAKGLWRLADNMRSWSIEEAAIYGISFSCIEAL